MEIGKLCGDALCGMSTRPTRMSLVSFTIGLSRWVRPAHMTGPWSLSLAFNVDDSGSDRLQTHNSTGRLDRRHSLGLGRRRPPKRVEFLKEREQVSWDLVLPHGTHNE